MPMSYVDGGILYGGVDTVRIVCYDLARILRILSSFFVVCLTGCYMFNLLFSDFPNAWLPETRTPRMELVYVPPTFFVLPVVDVSMGRIRC